MFDFFRSLLPTEIRKTAPFIQAEDILGEDFISPQQVAEGYSIGYSEEQVEALIKDFPSEKELVWCKDKGFVLLPLPPKALQPIHLMKEWPELFCHTHDGIEDVTNKTSSGWQAFGTRPVSDSSYRSLERQTELLSLYEVIPNSAEAMWFLITYFKVRGHRLFEDTFVRTSSTYLDDTSVVIGRFLSDGMVVEHFKTDLGSSSLGLLASRRF